jgi:hypothetical protein
MPAVRARGNDMTTLDLTPSTREAKRAELTARVQAIRTTLTRLAEGDAWPDAPRPNSPRVSPVQRAARALLTGEPFEVPPDANELRREEAVLAEALTILDAHDAADNLASLAEQIGPANDRLRGELAKVVKWVRAMPALSGLRDVVGVLQDVHAERDVLTRTAAAADGPLPRLTFDLDLETAAKAALRLLEIAEATLAELQDSKAA